MNKQDAAKSPEGAAMEARLIPDLPFEEIDVAIKQGFGIDVESLPQPHERRFSGAVLVAAKGDTKFISKWLRLFINARDEKVKEETAALHETIATLRAELSKTAEELAQLREIIKSGTFYPAYEPLKAELSRERERLRKSVLMEALKAVESERLDHHEEYLSVRDPDCAEDAAYSRAIRDAEIAIELLFAPQPAPVDTGGK